MTSKGCFGGLNKKPLIALQLGNMTYNFAIWPNAYPMIVLKKDILKWQNNEELGTI